MIFFQKFTSSLEQNTLVLSCRVDITPSLHLPLCRLLLFPCAYYPEIKGNISFIFHAILCVKDFGCCFFILVSPPPYFSRTVHTVCVWESWIFMATSLYLLNLSRLKNQIGEHRIFLIPSPFCVSLVKKRQGISSEGYQLGRVRGTD